MGFNPKKRFFQFISFIYCFVYFLLCLLYLKIEKYNLLRQDLTNNRRGLGIKPILE